MLYIFDLDGTLTEWSGRPANRPDEMRWIVSRLAFVRNLKEQGHAIALASNQGGVAWGHISHEQAEENMRYALSMIGGHYGLFCPHDERAKAREGYNPQYAIACNCRKPKPGMIKAIMALLDFDQNRTIFVGDREEDRLAAEAAQVEFINADNFFAGWSGYKV